MRGAAEPSSARRLRAEVLLLLGLAFLVRIGLVIATPDATPAVDAIDYDRIAHSLAQGDGFPASVLAAGGGPTALRPPVYPALLAGVYAVVDDHVAARAVQAVIGTATVGFVGVLGGQLLGRRVGLVAMAIAAVYPPLILLDSALLSESLFVALMLAAMAAGFAARSSPAIFRWAAASGALVGLAVLTRQNGVLLLLPVIGAIASARTIPRQRRLRACAAVVAVALLMVLPWAVRNAVEFDAFVPVATQSGLLLAGTYNDEARLDPRLPGAWRPPDTQREYSALFADPALNEAELDSELRERALRYARRHPEYVLRSWVRRFVWMLHLGGGDVERLSDADRNIVGDLGDASRWGFYVVAVLALAGAFTRPARAAPWYFWLTGALLLVSGVALAGLIRYRSIVDPFLVLLAASAVIAAADRLRGTRRTAAPAKPASRV